MRPNRLSTLGPDSFWQGVSMTIPLENDRAAWLHGPGVQCSLGPKKAQHPWRIVLLGAPGVGKGTQAELLHHRLGACHLSTGDVFRAANRRAACELSPAMAASKEYMCRGELVPDSTVWDMVRERSACLHCCGGFILDGFPRTLGQANALKELLKAENLPLTAVLDYELPLAEVVSRLSGRRTCKDCKAVFHIIQQPSKTEGICDHCGGSLFQREDDRPEAVTVRMQVYERATAPLIEFYKKHGLLLSIPA